MLAQEQAAEEARSADEASAPRPASSSAPVPRSRSRRRRRSEYAYVARDVKDIVRIAALLLGDPVRALDPDRRDGDHPRSAAEPARAPTMAPCPRDPSGPALAAPAPKPCSSHRPSGSRSPRGCARGTSTSSWARSSSSASAGRSAGASRAATSRRSCCGARPGPGKTTLARLLAEAVGAEFDDHLRGHVRRGRGARRRSPRPRTGWRSTARARCCSSTRSIASTRPSRTRCCPTSRTARSRSSARRPRTRTSRSTRALLSRMRVWRLEPLTDEDVAAIVAARARGRGARARRRVRADGGVAMADEPFEHLVEVAGGDARQALNILEGAVALAEDEEIRDADGRVSPTLAHVEAAAQQRVLAYDRAGDGHYDTVSAFIKSLRGNDPDGALYWLASMIAAGEDPRFIVRRLIIAASEDVGNADPRALQVAVAAAQALDHVGLPGGAVRAGPGDDLHRDRAQVEPVGRAYWAAAADVVEQRLAPGPEPPEDRGRPADEARTGSASGYRYPHEYRGPRRRAAVPARRARGPALLPAHRPGLRADDRRADGLPRGRSARRRRPPAARRRTRCPGRRSTGWARRARSPGPARSSRKKLAETQKRDAGA